MIETINDLINELKKYPGDKRVYYATKYALIPCKVKDLDKCISIDIDDEEQFKYQDWNG